MISSSSTSMERASLSLPSESVALTRTAFGGRSTMVWTSPHSTHFARTSSPLPLGVLRRTSCSVLREQFGQLAAPTSPPLSSDCTRLRIALLS
ncbi:uncharacterized protein METZ01_LOCUS1431 [marine metagenome]|uniref:Uncharacterized protein n=1 Tax=marine metagenome TaxID=408172 RepID=A0A381N225_9ZZZZ